MTRKYYTLDCVVASLQPKEKDVIMSTLKKDLKKYDSSLYLAEVERSYIDLHSANRNINNYDRLVRSIETARINYNEKQN